MNHISPQDQEADSIGHIAGIVRRHAFPPQVTGFDVTLGEFDGNPAIWIVFETSGGWIADEGERERDAAALNDLVCRVRPSLLHALSDRFPYVRFGSAAKTASAPT